MTGSVGAGVWMAAGYGAFLLLAAFGLDLAARRTASSSRGWRNGVFEYHEDHDAWVCPQDQWLWPQSFDPDNRVMRYRASPTVCNACPVKSTCTTSDHGREITRNVDPWPSSEAERFHRGIACMVSVLAVLWPLLTMLGRRTPAELAVLAGAAAVLTVGGLPLWSHLRRSPAGFPGHVRVETLDETVSAAQDRARAAARRRTTYASDRRRDAEHRERERAADRAVDPPGAEGPAGWSRLGRPR